MLEDVGYFIIKEMNIIIISLEKAPKRRNRIKFQLKELNIDAYIMDAVDGNKLRSEERRVGKSVDLGGRRIIKKKKK